MVIRNNAIFVKNFPFVYTILKLNGNSTGATFRSILSTTALLSTPYSSGSKAPIYTRTLRPNNVNKRNIAADVVESNADNIISLKITWKLINDRHFCAVSSPFIAWICSFHRWFQFHHRNWTICVRIRLTFTSLEWNRLNSYLDGWNSFNFIKINDIALIFKCQANEVSPLRLFIPIVLSLMRQPNCDFDIYNVSLLTVNAH